MHGLPYQLILVAWMLAVKYNTVPYMEKLTNFWNKKCTSQPSYKLYEVYRNQQRLV
jgi:hypothetical protein